MYTEVYLTGSLKRAGVSGEIRTGSSSNSSSRSDEGRREYPHQRENHRSTKISTPKIPIWLRMSKKHQKTPTTSVTNKKDQKKVTKRPKITGLFFITNDENELLRVLVIESCVRMGVTRRLLKKQKKNTNKVKFF
jgi:hypothetical protein